jgi:hypothetical protein
VGTRNVYSLAPAGLAAAQEWLVGTWDRALAAYAEALDDAADDALDDAPDQRA